jgi:hypothetical protein
MPYHFGAVAKAPPSIGAGAQWLGWMTGVYVYVYVYNLQSTTAHTCITTKTQRSLQHCTVDYATSVDHPRASRACLVCTEAVSAAIVIYQRLVAPSTTRQASNYSPFAIITPNVLSQSYHELRVSQKFYKAALPTTLSPHSHTLTCAITIRVFKA